MIPRTKIRRTAIAVLAFTIVGLAWLFGYAPRASGTSGPSSLWALLEKDATTGLSLVARQAAQPLKGDAAIVKLISFALAAIFIAGPGRIRLLRWTSGHFAHRHPDTDLAIFGPALLAAIVTPIAFVLAGLTAEVGIAASIRLLPQTAALSLLTLLSLGATGLGWGIGHALSSHDDPALRPVRLPPGLGRTIAFYPACAGAMLGLAALVDQTSQLLGASLASWFAAQGVIVVAEIVLIARILLRAGEVRSRMTMAEESDGVPAVFTGTVVVWGALAVACAAFLLGNVRFAMTVLQEILWVGLVLTMAWLITRFMEAVVARFLDSERRAARFATNVVGVNQVRVGQTALLLSAVFNVLIWTVGAILVLVPLQGGGGNVVQQVGPSPLRDALASMNLSPRTIITAAGVLIGGVALTRLVRDWLERRFLPTTHLDIGVRTSLVTGVSYLGIIAALLATTGALGVQLERITLIASALSVGIGFGLQAIIQNFVSGIILLAERPVKIGDRVTVGGSEGRISRIRVRATELIADDGEVAIVPNSSFISSTVVNKGAAVADASVVLIVKVVGPASAAEARDLLLHSVSSSDAIQHDPAPKIQLTSLGQSDWTFRIKVSPQAELPQREVISRLLFGLDRVDRDTAHFMVG